MAVDLEKRMVIANHLAALMRGGVGFHDNVKLRKQLFPSGVSAPDSLAHYALKRLDKLWWGISRRGRLRVTRHDWEKLRRWIAILNTDIDWDKPREPMPPLPKLTFEWLSILAIPATIAAMIAAGNIYDGMPLLVWAAIGCIVVPLVGVIVLRQPKVPSELSKPFQTAEQVRDAIPAVDLYDIPTYDAQTHGLSKITRIWRFPSSIALHVATAHGRRRYLAGDFDHVMG